MAGLGCGSFNFINNISSNKTYVFVKLTESAQISLHDFLNNEKKSKPTISFCGQEGEIRIPRNNHDISTFKFQVQRAQDTEGPQGSFECVRQTSSKSVESLGPMLSILRIRAKDDSYEKTKQSMAQAIAQNGKTCVKELKQNGVMSRHKTRPSIVVPPQKKEASSYSSNHFGIHNGNPPPGSPHNSIGGNSQGKPGWSQPPPRHQYPPPPPPSNLRRTGPPNPVLMKKPLRERIIHLLALKSMNKIQLMQKLHSDGIKGDRLKITPILSSIAIVKDNLFILRKHLWSEVNEDWPFYSEEEKLLLKRNKPQNESPSDRDPINNSSPPCPSLSMSPSSGGASQEAIKRRTDQNFDPTVKKSRFSASTRYPEVTSLSDSYSVSSSDQAGSRTGSSCAGSHSGASELSHKRSQNHPYDNPLHPDNQRRAAAAAAAAAAPSIDSPFLDHSSNDSLANGVTHGAGIVPPHSQSDSPRDGANGGYTRLPDSSGNGISTKRQKRKNGYSSKADQISTCDLLMDVDETNHVESTSCSSPDSQQEDNISDYIKQYPEIENVQQRRGYKAEFNRIYEEYKLLHNEYSKIKGHFEVLNEKLNCLQFESAEYFELRDVLIKEFELCKKDFRKKIRRYNYLEGVLHHIKERVSQFDNRRRQIR